jgi:hypothetical protein
MRYIFVFDIFNKFDIFVLFTFFLSETGRKKRQQTPSKNIKKLQEWWN